MKEQQPAGVLWELNPTAHTVSPAKYHPPTTSFIMFKKRAKSKRCVFTELLVKLIIGCIWTNVLPPVTDVLTDVTSVYGTF